jgi:5-hydroxyisourate hydrolase
MSPITTHVLDTSLGCPASGVAVELARADGEVWTLLAKASTNQDGRIADLLPLASLAPGTYRLRFETRSYFARRGQASFYPHVDVVFTIESGAEGAHYHVPLLLNPFGYSTYRGS